MSFKDSNNVDSCPYCGSPVNSEKYRKHHLRIIIYIIEAFETLVGTDMYHKVTVFQRC